MISTVRKWSTNFDHIYLIKSRSLWYRDYKVRKKPVRMSSSPPTLIHHNSLFLAPHLVFSQSLCTRNGHGIFRTGNVYLFVTVRKAFCGLIAGGRIGTIDKQNERNSSYVKLSHSLCFMSVCLMKSICYS